jgi:sugar phosphate isomerase/epimerase
VSAVKIGLHTITYAGLFYDGPALTLEDQIAKAAAYGFESVEVMAKRPVASPFDMGPDRCARAAELAAESGVDLDFIAGYVDLGRPNPVDRERELVWARETFRMARDLGGRYVRVYAGGETIHEGASVRQQWDWCVQGLKALVPVAADFGVQMALEIHTGAAQTVDALADMLHQVGDPSVAVVLDPPLLAFRGEDAADAYGTISEAAEIVHAHIGDFRRMSALVRYSAVPGLAVEYLERVQTVPLGEGIVQLEEFMRAAHEGGFEGALAFEVCTPFHVNHEQPTLADVERAVAQAVDWLKAKREEIAGPATAP